MRSKIVAILMLVIMAFAITSCYSSRKTGCPGNPEANSRFKG